MILLISASQVARITGVSHQLLVRSKEFKVTQAKIKVRASISVSILLNTNLSFPVVGVGFCSLGMGNGGLGYFRRMFTSKT
jgi:hypothetical protein